MAEFDYKKLAEQLRPEIEQAVTGAVSAAVDSKIRPLADGLHKVADEVAVVRKEVKTLEKWISRN